MAERTSIKKWRDKWFLHFHSNLNGGYGHLSYDDWQSAWNRAVAIEEEKHAS